MIESSANSNGLLTTSSSFEVGCGEGAGLHFFVFSMLNFRGDRVDGKGRKPSEIDLNHGARDGRLLEMES